MVVTSGAVQVEAVRGSTLVIVSSEAVQVEVLGGFTLVIVTSDAIQVVVVKTKFILIPEDFI